MTSKFANLESQSSSQEASVLKGAELQAYLAQLSDGWKAPNGHHLEKNYAFDDFRQALDFTNRVGRAAEEENHHPDIFLTWGKVGLKICTHSIDGLSRNDFILAAKADELRGSF